MFLCITVISPPVFLFSYFCTFCRKIVIAGAGYIAVELAGVLKELGSDVTLLIRKNKVIVRTRTHARTQI